MDIKTAFALAVKRAPVNEAIVEGNKRFTYDQWAKRVYALGNSLCSLGVKKSDRLLIGLKNREETALAIMALHVIGGIAVPYNPRSGASTVEYYLRDAEATGVLFDESTKEVLKDILSRHPDCGLKISAGENKDFKEIFDNAYDLEELIKSEEPNEPGVVVNGDDLGIIIYTSGTTGEPKGVPITHEMSIFRALGINSNHGLCFNDNHRVLGLMPLYHTIGIHGSLYTAMLYNGTYYPVIDFVPGDMLALIEREKITHIFASPTHFYALLEHSEFSPDRVASVRDALYAGAPMPTELVKRCADQITNNFTHIYGNTETFNSGFYKNIGTKPQATIQGMWHTIRIIKPGGSPDDIVDPGQEGELIISLISPESFSGYWNKPQKTANVCKGGWYFTGDSAHFDEEGMWYVTGRIDDMILSGGENIHPAEVEDVLMQHPDVFEVAVIGVPDKYWGQVVKAFVSLKKQGISEKDLDDFLLHTRLDKWKRPKQYKFINSIPRNPSGKIMRYLLREMGCEHSLV